MIPCEYPKVKISRSMLPKSIKDAVPKHSDLTTGIHGVGASTVESISGSQTKIDTHSALTGSIHGVSTGAVVENESGSQTKVDTHSDLTTGIHGVGGDVVGTTDAQSLSNKTLASDLDFAQYKAIAMICDNGATVPASPIAGQWFLHTPTGRTILLMYDGSNWIPIISLGTMTVYVDNTDGTDAIDKGGAVDAGAVKSVQYAINLIPGLVGGNVVININAETYAETVTIQGKVFTGNYTITLQGTLSSLDTGTCAAGSVAGTGTTQGTVVDDTGGWAVNGYQNKLVKFETGVNAGIFRLIDSNTATTLTIVGTWSGGAPAAGDTFTIYDWGTIISNIVVSAGQLGIVLYDLNLNNSTGLYTNASSDTTAYRCSFNDVRSLGVVNLFQCYDTTAATYCLWADNGSTIMLWRSKLSTPGAGDVGIRCNFTAMCQLYYGCVIDCNSQANAKGIYAIGGAQVATWSSLGEGYNRIRNCFVGCYADTGSQITLTSTNVYSGNTTDESAVAASYGYID